MADDSEINVGLQCMVSDGAGLRCAYMSLQVAEFRAAADPVHQIIVK